MTEITIKWNYQEYEILYSVDWEKSITVTYYEHDYENKTYLFKYYGNNL